MEVSALPLSQEEIALLATGPLFRNTEEGMLRSLTELEGASLVRFDPGVVYSPGTSAAPWGWCCRGSSR